MCGRFILSTPQVELEELLGRKFKRILYEPRLNIAPSEHVFTIKQQDPKIIQSMRWGMKPEWLKSNKGGLINIRSESLRDKSTYYRKLQDQRGVILANGFYEWEKSGNIKQPYLFQLSNGMPFVFPCIYEKESDGEACAIITVPANSLVGKIHHRMPAILCFNQIDTWLNQVYYPSSLIKLLSSYSSDLMSVECLSKVINSSSRIKKDNL